MDAVVAWDRQAATVGGADPWLPYFELRRNALRELAHHTQLSYFSRPGLFGALPVRRGVRGGGLWALGAAAMGPLLTTLRRAEPDWVAVAEPASAVLPAAQEHGWTVTRTFQAMAMADLTHLLPAELPATVGLHQVDLAHGDDGMSLEEALLVDVLHGDTDALSTARDLPGEVGVLRSLRGISLHAAVDSGGNCVGTAGCRIVGRSALICAVATIPSFRHRGIATALTTAAVDGARRAGATRAFLDASASADMYTRVGFRPLGTVTRCERPLP